MNRAERRRAARDMTHATQSIMRARGGYEREYERGAKDAERHAIKMIFARNVPCDERGVRIWRTADSSDADGNAKVSATRRVLHNGRID